MGLHVILTVRTIVNQKVALMMIVPALAILASMVLSVRKLVLTTASQTFAINQMDSVFVNMATTVQGVKTNVLPTVAMRRAQCNV